MSQSPRNPAMPSEEPATENGTPTSSNAAGDTDNKPVVESNYDQEETAESSSGESSEDNEQNWLHLHTFQSLSPQPPSPPLPWMWKCHFCRHYQPLTVTSRCIECGHHYCSGNPNSEKPKMRQPCTSVFDYVGWKRIRAQQRRTNSASNARQYHLTGCWHSCLYPSHCHHRFLPIAAQSALRTGYPHYLAPLPERDPGLEKGPKAPVTETEECDQSGDWNLERGSMSPKQQRYMRQMNAISQSELSPHNRARWTTGSPGMRANANIIPPSRSTPPPDTGAGQKRKVAETERTSHSPAKRKRAFLPLASTPVPPRTPANWDTRKPRKLSSESTNRSPPKRQRCRSEPPPGRVTSTPVEFPDDTRTRRASTMEPEPPSELRRRWSTRVSNAVSVLQGVASDARSRLTGSSTEPKDEDEIDTEKTPDDLERQDTPFPETGKSMPPPPPTVKGQRAKTTFSPSPLSQIHESIPATRSSREEMPVPEPQSSASPPLRGRG